MNKSIIEESQPEQVTNSEQKDHDKQVSPSIANANVIGGLVVGERVVWDSHFGYEIGYFLGEGVLFNSHSIDVRSGIIPGECSYSKNEIHKYSDELINSLIKKYGYEKRFSETF
jgi:hypothetical protein